MASVNRGFEEQFTLAVDGIFAAATNDSTWSQALVRMCDFVGAYAADLNVLDPSTMDYLAFHPARVDPFVLHYAANYMADLSNQNPRISKIYLPMGESEIISDSEVWTEKQMRAMPFFAEMLHPWGAFGCLNTWVRRTNDGRPWIALAVHFGRANSPPQEKHRQRLRMLIPHIRRAFGVEERLQGVLKQSAALAEILDHVAEPVALLSRDGKVIQCNKAAAELFKKGDGICLAVDGRLVIAKSEARDEFAKSLAQCASPIMLLSGNAAPPPQVVLHRLDKPLLILTLQSLSKISRQPDAVVAALFISDPSALPKNNLGVLRAAYGLSPAEVKVVQSLYEGLSLKEIASDRRISYETVRFHIRRILAKTGQRRQSDLLRLVRTMR